MAWDFSTDPDYQRTLDWVATFVREELEPLEVVFPNQEYLPLDETRRKVIEPLQQQVRDRGLWAAHLGPELGGSGLCAVDLALLNEILGRSTWASIVFGTMAPDTGNAEILARFGTAEQKETYLQPLLDGDIRSCFSVTEPQGGGDPKVFTTTAMRDGDDWVINGLKYFSSHADIAAVILVMAITNPDVPFHQGTSIFVIPRGTPGVVMEANHHLWGSPEWEPAHGLVRYDNVRVPSSAMLGAEGQGFKVMQTRMAGGRIHMSMRAIGFCQRALEMLAERAKSRFTQGSVLAEKQFVQGYLADSYTELHQFRLAVMHAAWTIDHKGADGARREIAMVKTTMAKVSQNIIQRTIQVHGALGTTAEVPLMKWMESALIFGIADGPSEVHRINLARDLFKHVEGTEALWPTQFLAYRLDRARQKYAGIVDTIPHIPAPVDYRW
jgi:alkylation response protein AidB-like acyl-CoA dehydrogenase